MAAAAQPLSLTTNFERATERLAIASRTPMQAVVVTRAMNAIAKLASASDTRTLNEAAGASSNYAVLLRILQQPEALVILADEQPHVAARLRSLLHRQALLHAEGGTLSALEIATQLGVTRQAVDRRRRTGKLIGVNIGRRGYSYPAWQLASEHGTLPGLREVLAALSEFGPWMQVVFMLNGNDRLDGEAPLATLRHNDLDVVLQAARASGGHGAA